MPKTETIKDLRKIYERTRHNVGVSWSGKIDALIEINRTMHKVKDGRDFDKLIKEERLVIIHTTIDRLELETLVYQSCRG